MVDQNQGLKANHRYGNNKEFTPMHKVRKNSDVTNKEIGMPELSPGSYYKFFKMNSELQKSINFNQISHRGDVIMNHQFQERKRVCNLYSNEYQ